MLRQLDAGNLVEGIKYLENLEPRVAGKELIRAFASERDFLTATMNLAGQCQQCRT